MAMGRPPKPTHLKIVQGNPGKRRLPKNELTPPAAEPDAPLHLSDEAAEEWRRVCVVLKAMGILNEADRAALAGYCQAYGRWRQAEGALKAMGGKDEATHGLIIKTKQGNYIQNPLLGIANKAMADMLRFAGEFGLTPSARARIGATPPEHDDAGAAKRRKFFAPRSG